VFGLLSHRWRKSRRAHDLVGLCFWLHPEGPVEVPKNVHGRDKSPVACLTAATRRSSAERSWTGLPRELFGQEQSLELPERAHRALDALSELRAILDGLYQLDGNPTKPVTADDIAQTRRNMRAGANY
jgi:hypothetical protein